MTLEYPYSTKRHGTTIEKCEQEPVQTPGCIQSHGTLVVLRKTDLTILQVSENSKEWLGYSPHQLLSQNVEFAVGGDATREIQRVIDEESLEQTSVYVTTLPKMTRNNDRPLYLSLHVSGGLILLEIEDANAGNLQSPDQLSTGRDFLTLLRRSLSRFQKTESVKGLCEAIAEEVRRITALDRVMVYYFHPDHSGEVLAEAKRADQKSWLGWRYPAHDIPQPAREIFKKIWSRPVPDARAELFEMVPLLNPDTHAPLDMTYCSLRGASVMYTEYLGNMGVQASLTMPLIRKGELWGLIACHHDTPRQMTYRIRASCEFIAQGASMLLDLAEEREFNDYRVAFEATSYSLISRVALKLDFSAFTDGPINLRSTLACGGAAVFYQDQWNTVGLTPSSDEMNKLVKWLLNHPSLKEPEANPVFIANNLPEVYPPAKSFAQRASGLLAFCFSRDVPGFVLYFRPETVQTLTWAGNPSDLPIIQGPHGPRLSPRKSFELWTETVREKSLPWKKVEIDGARRFRGLIINLVVAGAEQVQAVRSELETLRTAAADEILQAKAKFRLAVEAGDLGTWEMIPATGELEFSDRCRQLFGFSPEVKLDYATFLTAVHPEDREKTDRLVQRALDPGGDGRYDTEYRTIPTADGTVTWIRAVGKAIANDVGQISLFVGTVQDITDIVKARQDMLDRRDELQRMVEAQTAELRNTIGELEAFSYSISHDMRSPLRAMQGFSKALLSDYAEKLDAEGKDYLTRIDRGAKRLDLLIQDVLSYSRVAQGEIELLPIHLKDFIEEICRHHPEFQEPQATLQLQGPFPDVLAHEAFLSQVIYNLLGNAVKFQKPGEKPLILISADILEDKVRVWIKDNGVGIHPSHCQQIFKIFGKIHSPTQYPGTGIGLAVVRKAVERMRGEVGLESVLGKGSEFWFTLQKS